ncbi:hypothetical protein D3C87_1990330 [compost metagenome]
MIVHVAMTVMIIIVSSDMKIIEIDRSIENRTREMIKEATIVTQKEVRDMEEDSE